ncbi:MAG: hypothetical protein JW827_05535 [Spirochaetes bacterium]|nr:hypothetical protein [Spirochaetota bacterium]
MKYLRILTIVLLVLAQILSLSAEENELKGYKVKRFPFYIYTDYGRKINNFIPSGWLGDFYDLKINERWSQNPKSGKTCIQIIYTAEHKDRAGWAGICFQSNPDNYWGTLRGGYDLTTAKRLFFYARGEKGGETIEFRMGEFKKQHKKNKATTGLVRLTKDWNLYEINLENMQLNDIAGGFCVIFSSKENTNGCIVYLDELYYTDKENPIKISKIQTFGKERF